MGLVVEIQDSGVGPRERASFFDLRLSVHVSTHVSKNATLTSHRQDLSRAKRVTMRPLTIQMLKTPCNQHSVYPFAFMILRQHV